MSEWTPWGDLEAEREARWEAEAQRDRAVELLRGLTEVVDEKTWTAFAIAGLVNQWIPKARAFLAGQETNDEA